MIFRVCNKNILRTKKRLKSRSNNLKFKERSRKNKKQSEERKKRKMHYHLKQNRYLPRKRWQSRRS